jgi:hypothetical protein
MKKIFIFIYLISYSALLMASEHQYIGTLGASPRGQFVAIEEYGYMLDNHSSYSRIKVLNVWKKEYIGHPIHVEFPGHRSAVLQKARSKARSLAQGLLSHFQMSSF